MSVESSKIVLESIKNSIISFQIRIDIKIQSQNLPDFDVGVLKDLQPNAVSILETSRKPNMNNRYPRMKLTSRILQTEQNGI
ncbi:hypothetical protein COL922a_004277 [Colletotrichum nupharicola]|nr:hypothetical protein COL922a_004277 [Colletotrichum nupharicola]